MNKEKIAIYEELIEFMEKYKYNKNNEEDSAMMSVYPEKCLEHNITLDSIISHLKGRIEELKKDEK